VVSLRKRFLPILTKPEKLVVDANPILSALMGGQARRIFFESEISEFAVPGAMLEEVRRYVPRLARKLSVGHEFLHYALDLLPITTYSPRTYRHAVAEAQRQIAKRDPNDVEVVALAIALIRMVWTNDRDFEVTKVQRVTTAELLAICFPKR
jgi:predicted nucleic acid-binding protein